MTHNEKMKTIHNKITKFIDKEFGKLSKPENAPPYKYKDAAIAYFELWSCAPKSFSVYDDFEDYIVWLKLQPTSAQERNPNN